MTYQPPRPPPYTSGPPHYPAQQISAQPYSPAPVPGFGYPPQVVIVPARPSSGVAVWALVLGLVGFFFGWCMLGIPCLAAVIVGHAAVADTRNDAKSGRGMAVAGLVLGYLTLAPAVILFFWLVVGGLFGASTPTPTPSGT